MESIFVTKFSSIYIAKGEKRLVFRLSFVNLQRAKNDTHMFGVKYRYVSVVLITLELRLSCIKPSKWCRSVQWPLIGSVDRGKSVPIF